MRSHACRPGGQRSAGAHLIQIRYVNNVTRPPASPIWERGVALTSRLQSLETELLTQVDIHRFRGDLLPAGTNETAQAEQCFQIAVAVARNQSAKSLELRATMSLARLLRNRVVATRRT